MAANTVQSYRAMARSIQQGEIRPLYVFAGPEQVLAHDLLRLLRPQVVPEELADINIARFDGRQLTFAELEEAIFAPPMFGTRRLVIIDQPGFLKQKLEGDWDALLDTGRWPEDICCVLLAPEVDRRLKTYRTLNSRGVVLDLATLTRRDAIAWVEEQLSRARLQVPRGSGGLIVDRVGTDLAALRLEVAKLVGFAGKERRPLTAADLDSLISRNQQTSSFDLVDAIGRRELGKSLALIDKLLAEGQEPLLILGMIAKQLRAITLARAGLDARLPERDIIARMAKPPLQMHPYPAGKVIEQAQLWSYQKAEASLEVCLRADEAIKTGELKPDRALDVLLMELSQL
ncbi:MAG: DNA polymerase III subunit delta [Bacillota bacterium]|jgi:DNA polymerase-3 subunit delta